MAAAPVKTAPAASAIIPGSPLAALTGAALVPPAASDANVPTPYGTDDLGLSIISTVVSDADRSAADFTRAIRQSTDLAPVGQWLQSFSTDDYRRGEAVAAAKAVLMIFIPALLAEALVIFALARPRGVVIAYAMARRRQSELQAGEPAPLTENDAATQAHLIADDGEAEPPVRRVTLRAWITRLGLALVYILLALLPLAAFVLTGAVLLTTGLADDKAARLTVTGIANAYLISRLVLEAARFLFAPLYPTLRLIHTTDRRALWLLLWLRILLVSAGLGYILISTSEILGLGRNGVHVLTLLIALVLHVEVALLVWQSRSVVARWIRGKPAATAASAMRQRLAWVWHYVALFYVVALWVAYAGGIPNAFAVLLRIVVVFVLALIGGRLLWFSITQGADRLFEAHSGSVAHPALRARARAYQRPVMLVLRIVILCVILTFMLQGWGIQAIPWLLKNPFSRALVRAFIAIVITIAVALVVWEIANFYLDSRVDRLTDAGKARQAARLRTLMPMLKATLGVGIALVAGLICLSKIGVNAAPLLAGAGVLGIAIGFGSQKLVQDIITGLFLLLEDAMQVGDVITLAGMTGTVERLSIRTIRLRGGDGSINIIPFSAVTTVTNMTRDFGYAQISLNVAYDMDLDHVSAVLTDIARTMREEPVWGAMMRDDLQLFGLDQFASNALVITGQIRTGPGQHWAVRREYYARIKQRFAEEKINIPNSSVGGPTGILFDTEQLQTLSKSLRTPATGLPAPAISADTEPPSEPNLDGPSGEPPHAA